MYVPESWFHAVVNVDDVVAVSMQNTSTHTPLLAELQSRDLGVLKATTEDYPHRSDVFFSYGRALGGVRGGRRCAEAVENLDRALAMDDKFVLAYVEKAKCLAHLVGPDAAADVMERALRLNPYSFSTRREIAMLLERFPDHDFAAASESRRDWVKGQWVQGGFESLAELVASNLDLEKLTTTKPRRSAASSR